MSKQIEALKLALEGAANYIDALGGDSRKYRQALAEQTTQQQEPLTDEEIDKLPWGPHEGNPMTFAEGLRYFARAIEAAHGITGERK